ncbi:MAG TPA: (Fe-S)-binding protein [Burkholderiales bacterium]|jgi:heterodisulfide reductase subunit D|nr:(Fe-S)-binding protein [Burkholderiales bacterium]
MNSGGTLFLDAVRKRVDQTLDACTRCGKCVVACPMVEPAGLDNRNATAIVEGALDLLAGGPGTPDADRWAAVCTNSGKCIPACDYGVDPRFMVNMARVASKAKLGGDTVRRGAHQYFSTMNRSTRMISRLLLSAEVLERLSPPLRAAGEYGGTPDIVFYTGCNIIKTPHIALLVLEVLDRLGVTYEVMGGVATCCGIQQFKQGDAKTAGRVGFNTIERLARPGASRVISWCPSCQIQIGEFALPAYRESFSAMPFDMDPIAEFFAERLADLRPLFVHPVAKRVALQERSALPGVMVAVKKVLSAIPGLEVVELDVPVVSTQASHLSVLPKYKAELREREFRAAAEAGVTTFASIFHGCHRELVKFQPQVSFELLNFMELIGEAMGIHIPDLYKRLQLLGDIDAIIAETSGQIAAHGLDLDEVRDALAQDMFGAKPKPRRAQA